MMTFKEIVMIKGMTFERKHLLNGLFQSTKVNFKNNCTKCLILIEESEKYDFFFKWVPKSFQVVTPGSSGTDGL